MKLYCSLHEGDNSLCLILKKRKSLWFKLYISYKKIEHKKSWMCSFCCKNDFKFKPFHVTLQCYSNDANILIYGSCSPSKLLWCAQNRLCLIKKSFHRYLSCSCMKFLWICPSFFNNVCKNITQVSPGSWCNPVPNCNICLIRVST